ncbi:hypothetical protein Tco_1024511 [Tanacetum coccineum]
MATPEMSLKLLYDKKGQMVLFVETPKEFVDFIFHIFSLPLGTGLIEFIGSEQMVGCLDKLKDSIENFHRTYLQPGVKKIISLTLSYLGKPSENMEERGEERGSK